MRPMAWLLGLVALGAVTMAVLLQLPERGPGEVDHPDATVGGPPVSTTGTLIDTIQSMGGREDFSELVGRPVVMTVDIGQAANDVAFWTGSPPDELLVVIDRSLRSAVGRDRGLPVDTDFTPPPRGLVTVRGVVEPLPYAEAMYSWGLTRRDVAVAQERGVYVRMVEVVSPAPFVAPPLAAEEVDEFERETAPPPGEQVETPLELPPPPP